MTELLQRRQRRAVPTEPLLLAAMVVAVALVWASAPEVLRAVIALPILVVVPGWLLTRILLPRRAAADTDDLSSLGLVRACLPLLAGILLLLADVLVVNLLPFHLSARAISVGALIVTVVLLVAGRVLTPTPAGQPAPSELPAPVTSAASSTRARQVVGVVLAAVALIGAVALARVMQPAESGTSYRALTLSAPALGANQTATAGSDVTLRWTLDTFGAKLAGTADRASVSVAGKPVTDHDTFGPAVAGSDGAALAQTGSATFRAPSTAGTYRVVVTVSVGSAGYTVTAILVVTS